MISHDNVVDVDKEDEPFVGVQTGKSRHLFKTEVHERVLECVKPQFGRFFEAVECQEDFKEFNSLKVLDSVWNQSIELPIEFGIEERRGNIVLLQL